MVNVLRFRCCTQCNSKDVERLPAGVRAPHRRLVGRVTARATLLDGQQAQPAVTTFMGDGVMAVLAIDRIRRSQLAAGLADVQQRAIGGAGRVAALHQRPRTTIWVVGARAGLKRAGGRRIAVAAHRGIAARRNSSIRCAGGR